MIHEYNNIININIIRIINWIWIYYKIYFINLLLYKIHEYEFIYIHNLLILRAIHLTITFLFKIFLYKILENYIL